MYSYKCSIYFETHLLGKDDSMRSKLKIQNLNQGKTDNGHEKRKKFPDLRKSQELKIVSREKSVS